LNYCYYYIHNAAHSDRVICYCFIVLCLQLKPVPIGRLFELNADVQSTQNTQSTDDSNSVTSLLSKLIQGQLIYPWI